MRSLFAVLLLALGCVSPESRPKTADVSTFLQHWIVDRNLDAARGMFRSEFDEATAIDSDRFPAELRDLKRSDRALRYPEIAGCRTQCTTLDECISADDGGGAFKSEATTIHPELIRDYSDLGGLEGKTAQLITFVFEECNVGTTIVFVPDHDRPIAMIGFIAPE